VTDILRSAGLTKEDIDLFLFHQATRKMLAQLQERLALSGDRLPIVLHDYGNTVSSTIPIVIHEMREKGRLRHAANNMLVGFGVGWSWAGCIWQDHWRPVYR
jgi:3-oxoacyl-[acyl-carrier-protein] synthase-3